MKKSILILGRQGAGKTTLLHSMMSEKVGSSHGLFAIMTNEMFSSLKEKIPLERFSCIGIDEVSTVEDLKNIVDCISSFYDGYFVVCSSLPFSDIPESLLSQFEVHIL